MGHPIELVQEVMGHNNVYSRADAGGDNDSEISTEELESYAATCRAESKRPDASFEHVPGIAFARMQEYQSGSSEIRDFFEFQAKCAEAAMEELAEFEAMSPTQRHQQALARRIAENPNWELVNMFATTAAIPLVVPGMLVWGLGALAIVTKEAAVTVGRSVRAALSGE